LAIDLITLTEGDLHGINETVHDITNEALQDFMQMHQTMLGALRMQLKELQVQPPQVGTLSTHLTLGSSIAEHILHAWMENTIVFPEGAIIVVNVTDIFSISMLKGLGLNLAALSQETLYQLWDGITTKLWARESHAIQFLNE